MVRGGVAAKEATKTLWGGRETGADFAKGKVSCGVPPFPFSAVPSQMWGKGRTSRRSEGRGSERLLRGRPTLGADDDADAEQQKGEGMMSRPNPPNESHN
ncbi:hypothetical protein niasHT_036341 [Heterodera trifolii]|uniref:Uncharacterized protein n=1 Tax=Heterodera trifolii TaxID=157864 RepID=A0ABD2IUC4_9BILA